LAYSHKNLEPRSARVGHVTEVRGTTEEFTLVSVKTDTAVPRMDVHRFGEGIAKAKNFLDNIFTAFNGG
jgi:hypothetical protein